MKTYFEKLNTIFELKRNSGYAKEHLFAHLLQSPRHSINDSSSKQTYYRSEEAHIVTAPGGHQPYTGAACTWPPEGQPSGA